MSPEELTDSHVIWMTKKFDVLMQLTQLLFAVIGIDSERHFDFFVKKNEDSDALSLLKKKKKMKIKELFR
jgi:hypothetical protein